MKILEIIPSLGSGGGERFVVDLSNAFANKGHECTIVTLYDKLESDILRHFVKPNVLSYSLGKSAGFDIRCLIRVYKYIHQTKPNVVHVHLGAILYVLFAALLCRKVKFFATIHSEARREAGSHLQKWVRMFLFKTGLVTPVTISLESEKSFWEFYKHKSKMIPNGCEDYNEGSVNDDEYINYREGVDYLLFHAGRVHGVKNQLMLVRAFKELIDSGVNARLLIAGRVEDSSIYEELKKFFSHNIIYLGERSDTRVIMNYSDAFCLSSSMEGMPITVIEAMSVGCVSIVTPVGGCINVVNDSVNGFVAEDITKDSYLRALERFVKTPENVRVKMRKACLDDFNKKYSIDITASTYINLFTSK